MQPGIVPVRCAMCLDHMRVKQEPNGGVSYEICAACMRKHDPEQTGPLSYDNGLPGAAILLVIVVAAIGVFFGSWALAAVIWG